MKIAFISDLHLSPNTFDSNQLFYSLMQRFEKELDALYILGDFFDYWIGDDDNNVFISEIKSSFKNFTKIKPLYFIRGNHDFGLGKRFAKETGITLLNDCSILNIESNRILLSHGDMFCTLDTGYLRFKKIIQNPLVMFLLRKIPLKWRYKLKDKLESKSNTAYDPLRQHIYKVVDASVVKTADKYNANIVIHGHTHDPAHYKIKLENGKELSRIEIPDWVDHKAGGYVLLDGENITIHLK